MNVTERVFGCLHGKDITSYTITNNNGMEMTCIEYGCIITSIRVPDKEGTIENVVLGFDSIEEYATSSPYFGCVIGRNAGRIENARFQVDGHTYSLTKNDGEHNLHSGPNGFHTIIWNSSCERKENEVHITFSHTSPDGDEGFPGTLQATVTYIMNEDNELVISYHAVSDQTTMINLTNHTYFNLSGSLKRTIVDHELWLQSDRFLELDTGLIPTGNAVPVEGTVFDCRKGRNIMEVVSSEHPQIKRVGGGYDHPFVLTNNHQREIVLVDKESGRKLEIETDEPCVVVYTGNSLSNDMTIRGTPCEKYLGMCLETQKPPNMIHHPDFPSLLVEANQAYTTKTIYSFGLEGGQL